MKPQKRKTPKGNKPKRNKITTDCKLIKERKTF